MTYQIYSHQQLHHKSIARLKQIYSEIGCTVEVTDKRCKDTWVNAIITHQSAQLQKVDEQALAQTELDHYITAQAQAIAPQLTTVEINSNHHEVFCGKQLVAYIAYDYSEFVTQPWLVMVNGKEKFRHTTLARCHRFIQWHHKDGTLNSPIQAEVPKVPTISEISFYDQEAFVNGELVASIFYDHDNYQDLYWRVLVNDIEIFRDTTPARCHSYVKQQYQQGILPVQEPFEEPCTTSNEIMAQIFNECEKHGFEILDDGIYRDGVKLGQVGCTDDGWWIVRVGESQERVPCESVESAVQSLLVVEAVSYEKLLDLPFEQLTLQDWQRLLDYEPHSDLVAA